MNDADKPDGEYDAKVDKYDCVEKISTVEVEDGMLETRIDYTIKQANQWKFALSNRQKRNYGEIDWNK